MKDLDRLLFMPGGRARWLAGTLIAVATLTATAVQMVPARRPSMLPASTARVAEVASDSPTLDALRAAASLGEPTASLILIRRLLARYDELNEGGALIEASLWFDRQWQAGDEGAFAVVQPLFKRQCGHPLMQWHWVCETGE